MSIWKFGNDIATIGGESMRFGGKSVTIYGNNEQTSGWTTESEFNANGTGEQSLSHQAGGGAFTLTEDTDFSVLSAGARSNNANSTADLRICLYNFNISTEVVGTLVARSTTTTDFVTGPVNDETALTLGTWDVTGEGDFQLVPAGDYIWSLQATGEGFKVAASAVHSFDFTYYLASVQAVNPGDEWNGGGVQTGNQGKLVIYGEGEASAIGSPTLTTPFPIGTNNGPLFSATSSDTIATVEAADFLNDRVGWASLLNTDDVVIIECSDGTKMYNVTVNTEQRIISLSTGLVIA